MKRIVNGVEMDCTIEQEAEILSFQSGVNRDIKRYKMNLQQAIDAQAMEKEYGDGALCASYVSSTNPKWAAEAQAFIAWRDTCYVYAYDYLDKVESGEILEPNIEVFLNGMPEIVWPIIEV